MIPIPGVILRMLIRLDCRNRIVVSMLPADCGFRQSRVLRLIEMKCAAFDEIKIATLKPVTIRIKHLRLVLKHLFPTIQLFLLVLFHPNDFSNIRFHIANCFDGTLLLYYAWNSVSWSLVGCACIMHKWFQ